MARGLKAAMAIPGVVAAFLISALASGAFIWSIEQVRQRDAENQARQLANTVAHDFAERLDRSLSWVVQRAWKISRLEIKKLPSVNEVDGNDDDDDEP